MSAAPTCPVPQNSTPRRSWVFAEMRLLGCCLNPQTECGAMSWGLHCWKDALLVLCTGLLLCSLFCIPVS